ncbi:nuclease-related domain-containing protein [Psychrobacillus sp. FSL H8-0484]|uniref:nuclease-related domain-containing protein n=1 Tax=Psychrobacillus sp. FSL H8-0484 TaxID=2921390 RepID=UPI0030FA01FC
MIAKKYSTTLYVEALKALYKRLPRKHPKLKLIQDEYHQKVAGDLGEEVVMKVLEQVQLPYKFYVFHNISLYTESLFQMDILIISPYYAVIFEVKNIKGEISFTTNPLQLVRKLETGEINTYDSPVLQLEEYVYHLNQLLRGKHIHLPIYSAIVFAFNSYIKTSPSNTIVLSRKEIKSFLRKIKIDKPLLSSEDLDKLKDWILNSNYDFLPFPICNHFSISPESILKGVECVQCGLIGMRKVSHNWFCPRCKIYHKKAHEQALRDYFFIYKNTMTNKECQQFLKLNNKHEATRILKNSMLMKTGQSRNAKYSILFSKLNDLTRTI